MISITCDRCGFNEELKDKNNIEKIIVTKDLSKQLVTDSSGGTYKDYVHMFVMDLCTDCQVKLNVVIATFLQSSKQQKRT